jgi:hypothetical protein
MTDDRRQRTENRRQRTETRLQMTGDLGLRIFLFVTAERATRNSIKLNELNDQIEVWTLV